MKRQSTSLLIGAVMALFCALPSSAATEVSPSTPEISESDAVLMHFPRKLVHHVAMNNTPVREVISELCRRGEKIAILDKSTEGKVVTAEYRDLTLAEILSDVLALSGLRAKFISDNVLLVESSDAKYAQSTYRNVGDSDTSPPLSDEIEKRARILEAQQKALEAQKSRDAAQQQTSWPSYGRYGLIPKPPETPTIQPSRLFRQL